MKVCILGWRFVVYCIGGLMYGIFDWLFWWIDKEDGIDSAVLLFLLMGNII